MRMIWGILVLVFWSSAANAVCGFRYPGCTVCQGWLSQQGDKIRPAGCIQCSSICVPFLTTAEVERQVNSKPGMRVSEGILFIDAAPKTQATPYLIEIPRSQLSAIAQVNPMAAVALLLFTKEFHTESVNPLSGELAFGGIPTFATIVQIMQGVDERLIDDSQTPIPSGKGFVRVKWTGARTGLGLRITLESQRIDEDGVVVTGDLVYPTVIANVRPGRPGLISTWALQ